MGCECSEVAVWSVTEETEENVRSWCVDGRGARGECGDAAEERVVEVEAVEERGSALAPRPRWAAEGGGAGGSAVKIALWRKTAAIRSARVPAAVAGGACASRQTRCYVSWGVGGRC